MIAASVAPTTHTTLFSACRTRRGDQSAYYRKFQRDDGTRTAPSSDADAHCDDHQRVDALPSGCRALRCGGRPRDFRGRPAVAPIDPRGPLGGRVAQQLVAILPQVRRQFDPQRVLDFRGLQQRRQHRRGREIGNRESVPYQIPAGLEFPPRAKQTRCLAARMTANGPEAELALCSCRPTGKQTARHAVGIRISGGTLIRAV
jgi:hypothetical protein